ncbi:EamA family transporter [Hyphomonas sp.]|uniref:EamA family transporter n=1 Tax=Hyphomonas sp. TaxID=87 RepID=UPI003918A2FE
MRSLPLHVISLLVLTPFLIAAGQVMFKLTGEKLAAYPAQPLQSAVFSPIFLGAMALYGGATLLWVYVLKTVPLSYAYSFMALTFVIVPVLAHLWFGEPLNAKYFAGMALILAGLFTLWS